MKKLFTFVVIACVAVIGCKKKDTSSTSGTGASPASPGKGTPSDKAELKVKDTIGEIKQGAKKEVTLVRTGDKSKMKEEDVKVKASHDKITVDTAKIGKESEEAKVTINVGADVPEGEQSVTFTVGGMEHTAKFKVAKP